MLFLPDHCAVCKSAGPSPCDGCIRDLKPPPAIAVPSGVEAMTALFSYEGKGRQLIGGMKFHNRRSCVRWIGHSLAQVIDEVDFECISWMPSSHAGKSQRGYDVGKAIARKLSKQLGLPAYNLMVRVGSERQTHRPIAQRRSGPELEALPRAFRTRSVLLIDDVCTTGASLSTAAQLLRSCGVVHVSAAVAARTPLR